MHTVAKEHFLHKVLAGSAFALALSLLPIVHYLHAPSVEGGTVAGASTDATITSPSCLADRQQKLDDLDRWMKGRQVSDLAQYTQASATTDNPSALYDTYVQKLARDSSVVASQKADAEAVPCPLP